VRRASKRGEKRQGTGERDDRGERRDRGQETDDKGERDETGDKREATKEKTPLEERRRKDEEPKYTNGSFIHTINLLLTTYWGPRIYPFPPLPSSVPLLPFPLLLYPSFF
jgi:hypothetical protein